MAFKLALLVASLAVAAQASNTLWGCPGNENNLLQFNISMPEVFTFPGVGTWSFHSIRKVDMPLDLVMDFKVRKTAPYAYDVPCLAGDGSCVLDMCNLMTLTPEVCTQQNFFYSGFPYAYSHRFGFPYAIAPPTCGCLGAGEVNLQNIQWTLPDLGRVKAVVVGDYEVQATFYGKSRPDLVLGCVNKKFSVA